jgi:ABC-type dipeptide/oligopeptide/nickel transport system permease component
MSKVSTICFFVAMAALFIAIGVSNDMKRSVYNRSGKSFRALSRQTVHEYRALYGQDRNYWAYCLSWLAFSLGMAGFALFPK